MSRLSPQVKLLLDAIGYQFSDPELLLVALTHKSVVDKEAINPHGANNERMEFLGDAVLSLVTASYLYQQNSFLSEGELSQLRARFVCQDSLSNAARNIDLGRFIMGDRAMRASGSKNSKAVLADAVEAIIGAVYIDGGLKAAEEVVFKLVGIPSTKLGHIEKDAKTRLQEKIQAETHTAPKYVVLETQGPAHAPTFLIGVKIRNEIVASATGESKKLAAQMAASLALEKLLNVGPSS